MYFLCLQAVFLMGRRYVCSSTHIRYGLYVRTFFRWFFSCILCERVVVMRSSYEYFIRSTLSSTTDNNKNTFAHTTTHIQLLYVNQNKSARKNPIFQIKCRFSVILIRKLNNYPRIMRTLWADIFVWKIKHSKELKSSKIVVTLWANAALASSKRCVSAKE